MRTLVWYRGKDLRTADHAPLRAAAPSASCKSGEVIPLFVLDEHFFRPEAAQRTPFRIQFLLESIASLAANLEHLGSRLILVNGRSVEVIPRLASLCKVDRVVAQSWVAPIGRERDRVVAFSRDGQAPSRAGHSGKKDRLRWAPSGAAFKDWSSHCLESFGSC